MQRATWVSGDHTIQSIYTWGLWSMYMGMVPFLKFKTGVGAIMMINRQKGCTWVPKETHKFMDMQNLSIEASRIPYTTKSWLVVWNVFYVPYIENNNPN